MKSSKVFEMDLTCVNIISLPSVVKIDSKLALYDDGCIGDAFQHRGKAVDLNWLKRPIVLLV